MKTAVVIPTNRNVDFLKDWEEEFKDSTIYVVVDRYASDNIRLGPKEAFKCPNVDLNLKHFFWEDISQDLGDDAWIISRGSSAVRNFGFIKAWKDGADVIITLDDDCYPIAQYPSFVQSHVQRLFGVTTSDSWHPVIHNIPTRGMPNSAFDEVGLSVGGWLGIPDISAAVQLDWKRYEKLWNNSTDDFQCGVIPTGKYYAMSGMNLAFTRDLIPLMYFAPTGSAFEYDRFEDIWCGIIQKKICDHLHIATYFGYPFVLHNRASDPVKNLELEKKGNNLNETFWQMIDNITLTGYSPLCCIKEVSDALKSRTGYLNTYGKALAIWADLFEK